MCFLMLMFLLCCSYLNIRYARYIVDIDSVTFNQCKFLLLKTVFLRVYRDFLPGGRRDYMVQIQLR